MKNLKFYLDKAEKEKWAIGQFNFSTLEQLHGIVEAARKLKSPVILGTSEGESKFFGLEEAVALRNVLRNKLRIPFFLNLDHGKSFEYLKSAIDAGYDMVHFDGSKLPLDENIKIAKQVKKYAKWRGVLTEGEVGRIGFEAKEEDLTNFKEAKKFAEETGVDLLAISIGNFHGSESPKQEPKLRLDKLEELRKAAGRSLFVLHGGSGTNEQDVKKAIELGVVKININTELRLAFASGLRGALENSDEIVPYKFLSQAVGAVEKTVELKINLFGSLDKL